MGWILPTASEILREQAATSVGPASPLAWPRLIAALEQLIQDHLRPSDASAPGLLAETVAPPGLRQHAPTLHGLVVAGPFPLFPQFTQHLGTWTLGSVGMPLWPGGQLPAARLGGNIAPPGLDPPDPGHPGWSGGHSRAERDRNPSNHRSLSLLPIDPLLAESFGVVFLPDFCFALAATGESLEGDQGGDRGGELWFSFTPETVLRVWGALRSRLNLTQPQELLHLDALVAQFPAVEPPYHLVAKFSGRLLGGGDPPLTRGAVAASEQMRRSDDPAPWAGLGESSLLAGVDDFSAQSLRQRPPTTATGETAPPSDLELLQAIAHGVKTPLAAIRTWVRLLLRRSTLADDARGYLEKIDRECTDQIERFDLIFTAVELETSPNSALALASFSLPSVLETAIPRWQAQAERHGLTLVVLLPTKLPAVASDPTLLERMLSEMIDRLTRTLPRGGQLDLVVSLAGTQLKVQLFCQAAGQQERGGAAGLRSLGQLLDFQPETGNFSLNRAATKSLFQAIGGKFVVRQRSRQGEVLTIFLPLARS